MSSILSSQGMVLATAMAVSGTVILLAAFRLQKSPSSTSHFPSSCIISSDDQEKKREKKKKKRVHFAEDVVDPIGNSDEYRKLHRSNMNSQSAKYSTKGGKIKEMPANRVALYNGMLRDKVLHRVAYSCP